MKPLPPKIQPVVGDSRECRSGYSAGGLGERKMLANSRSARSGLVYFRSLAAAIVLFFAFAATALAQTPQELLQQADAALQKEDYATAAAVLETYLAQQPEDYRAEFNLALAYSLTGRRAEAIRFYKNVLSREKELTAAHRNLGILLLQDGNPTEAVDYFRFVAGKEPLDVPAHLNLGEALALAERVPEARETYEKVLQLQPDHVTALLALAELLAETDPAAAERHLRHALQVDSSLDDARLRLAALLEARATAGTETLAEAAEIYLQHLEKYPGRNDLRQRLGQLYLHQNRFSAAAEQLEAARAAGGASGDLSEADLSEALLQAYLQDQEKEKAEALLREMLLQAQNEAPNNTANTPDRYSKWFLLYGRLQMDKMEYQRAAEAFFRVTELQPEQAEGYTNLASAFYLLKNYGAVVKALEKVAELKEDTAGTYFLRAISLDKLRVLEAALENYQRFLELDQGKNPNQQFQARERIKVLTLELK